MSIPSVTSGLIPLRPWRRPARGWIDCALVAWGTVIVGGFVLLLNHQSLAGRTAGVPSAFPQSAATLQAYPGPTLLMFAHPRCPCTRASLQELSNLLAQASELSNVHVILPQFPGAGQDATQASNVQWALHMQGVQVTEDEAGKLAQLFGAQTSGHVLLYDAQDRLLFSGGITPLRGHEGASAGSAAILAHLRGKPAPAAAPVFGCALLSPELDREPAPRS